MLKEVRPANASTSRGLDPLCGVHARFACSRQQAMDMGLGNLGKPGKLPGCDPRLLEFGPEVAHTTQGNTLALTVQASRSYSRHCRGDHNSGMPRYVQQPALKLAVKSYQARTGKTQQEVAEDLGTTLGTLRQWLNNKERKPELESLQKISALTRVSVMQFIDDPGRDYAGQDLSQESEETCFLASMIIRGVMKKDLTDEQKDYILQDISRAVDRVASMPPGASGSHGKDRAGKGQGVQPGAPPANPRRTPRPKR